MKNSSWAKPFCNLNKNLSKNEKKINRVKKTITSEK